MAPLRVSTTKSEWLPDDPTAFVPTRLWKLPFITTWDDSRNQNRPTDSAEEAFLCSLRLSLRSLHCYPQEFCYFAQISCCPRQFRYRGVLRSGYGRNRNTSEIGEEIAMRVGNFLDQRVSPQHPQFPAHGCAA